MASVVLDLTRKVGFSRSTRLSRVAPPADSRRRWPPLREPPQADLTRRPLTMLGGTSLEPEGSSRGSGGGGGDDGEGHRRKRQKLSGGGPATAPPRIFGACGGAAAPWIRLMRNTDVQRQGTVLYLRLSVGGPGAAASHAPAINADAAPEVATEADRRPGRLVAGLPRPGTLGLNALRLQLEARVASEDAGATGGYASKGYPSAGNVEWHSPLAGGGGSGGGGCVFLAVDLERCLGRSESGRAVLIAKAAFQATVPTSSAAAVAAGVGGAAATERLDIALSLSCVQSEVRAGPVCPPAAPPGLPAAVEDQPAWPHAWRAATMTTHGENVGVIIDNAAATDADSGDAAAVKSDDGEAAAAAAEAAAEAAEAAEAAAQEEAARRRLREHQQVVLPEGQSVSQRERLTASARVRVGEQRRKQLLIMRQAAVQSLKNVHEAA